MEQIVQAVAEDLPSFFSYISRQLADNGRGNVPLFQPVSRTEKTLPNDSQRQFRHGITLPFQDLAWRRLWLVKDQVDDIRGHIDLRHHGDPYCCHRVRLGMGVESRLRGRGLGSKLLETVIDFCRQQPSIDWLDLCVLGDNTPAKKLYQKYGFTVLGETPDRYRIDGHSVAEVSMTKPMNNQSDV